MKYEFSDTYEETPFNIKYAATLSDELRALVNKFPAVKRKCVELIQYALTGFDENEEVKKSLQENPKQMRQMDLRNETGQILMKIFAIWNRDFDCWHVYCCLDNEPGPNRSNTPNFSVN